MKPTRPAFMPGTVLAIMVWSKTRTADTTIFIFGIQDLVTQIYYSVMSEMVDLVEDGGLMWPYIKFWNYKRLIGAVKSFTFRRATALTLVLQRCTWKCIELQKLFNTGNSPGPGWVLNRVVIIMDQLLTRHWADHPDSMENITQSVM